MLFSKSKPNKKIEKIPAVVSELTALESLNSVQRHSLVSFKDYARHQAQIRFENTVLSDDEVGLTLRLQFDHVHPSIDGQIMTSNLEFTFERDDEEMIAIKQITDIDRDLEFIENNHDEMTVGISDLQWASWVFTKTHYSGQLSRRTTDIISFILNLYESGEAHPELLAPTLPPTLKSSEPDLDPSNANTEVEAELSFSGSRWTASFATACSTTG